MSNKSNIRKQFRLAVFQRDGYRCKCCGVPGKDRQGGDEWKKFHKDSVALVDLDSHHILNRNELVNGGYIKSNGITVCTDCHLKCEVFWETGTALPGFSPEELFQLIGSSKEKAIKEDDQRGIF